MIEEFNGLSFLMFKESDGSSLIERGCVYNQPNQGLTFFEEKSRVLIILVICRCQISGVNLLHIRAGVFY